MVERGKKGWDNIEEVHKCYIMYIHVEITPFFPVHVSLQKTRASTSEWQHPAHQGMAVSPSAGECLQSFHRICTAALVWLAGPSH